MAYTFENKIYEDFNKLTEAVMASHPELLDDSIIEFIEFSGEVEEVC